jgi:hypothetical protein
MKNRVVVCLAFGLGNQLLQFSTGYTLSRRLNLPLDLDISWFDRDPDQTAARELLLLQVIGDDGYRNLLQYSRFRGIRDRFIRLASMSWKQPIRHGLPMWLNRTEYSEPFNRIDRPVCITGVPDLNFDKSTRGEILSILSDGISRASDCSPPDEDYAFVHVRLGDYVSNPRVAKKMVGLSKDYYMAGMRRFEERHGPTRWIVCSDDPEAAIDRLPRNFAIECSDSCSEFDDLYIMSQSRGGVIANSTFSLWGGLLAGNNNGTVVAPKVWRNDGPEKTSLPEGWVIL